MVFEITTNSMPEALLSRYIIDGTAQDFTPAEMLDECMDLPKRSRESGEEIVDESLDPDISVPKFKRSSPDEISAEYPEATTKRIIASALIDEIWRDGKFSFEELSLALKWHSPNPGVIGEMAAFYASSQAAADYIGSLGINLTDYSLENAEDRKLEVKVHGGRGDFSCQDKAKTGFDDSWIIYLPFDTCDFRSAPQIVDADYFLDCFELVRELVEDKVVIAGRTVGAGGLRSALEKFCRGKYSIGGILGAYPRCSKEEILGSEVPGALIQIADADFDYIDAEFLLQDVAYYPLGHPSEAELEREDRKTPHISMILDSLLKSASQ